jgi:hypothetical protein
MYGYYQAIYNLEVCRPQLVANAFIGEQIIAGDNGIANGTAYNRERVKTDTAISNPRYLTLYSLHFHRLRPSFLA